MAENLRQSSYRPRLEEVVAMMGSKSAQSQVHYAVTLDQLVPEDHFVRRLYADVDFSFVRPLALPRYSVIGPPSVDPEVLLKLIVLGYWEGIRSMRQLCAMAEVNMAWRWLLNYEIGEEMFTYSVISKFYKRMGEVFFKEALHEIVQQCVRSGLVQGKSVYIDGTMSDANASIHHMGSRALLEQVGTPEDYVETLHVVTDGDDDDKTPPSPAPPREKKPRGQGLQPSGEPEPSKRLANEMLASRTDMDAELFRKEDEPQRLCHKTQIAVDSGPAKIITAALVRPATEHDSHALEDVMDEHERNVGKAPENVVADKGFSTQDAYRHMEERGVRAVIPPKHYANNRGGLQPAKFIFDKERNVYICPEGHELKEFSLATRRHITIYKPRARTCITCAIKTQCTTSKGDRSISRRWASDQIESAAALLETKEGASLYRRRMHVCEAPNAELKTQGQMGRAKFRGRSKMAIQALSEAITYDLKRLTRASQYLAQEGMAAISALQGTFAHLLPRPGLQAA